MDQRPEAEASARPHSPFWLWPYAFTLLVIGGSVYGFVRLMEAPAVAAMPSRYSAIAYSPSTGEFGDASGCASLAIAESEAKSRCKKPDARIVVWTRGSWCALAVGGDHSFGYGNGSTQAEAEAAALTQCRVRTKSTCRIAVAVSSQGTATETPEPNEARGTYNAIAYSRSTGLFGSSQGAATYAEAETIALAGCNAPDAQIVTWSHGRWCALATAEDKAYGYSWADTKAEAEHNALEHCKEYSSGTSYHLAVVVGPQGAAK